MACRLCILLLAVNFTFSVFAHEKDMQKHKIGCVKRVIRSFSAVDTNYVEPQHYNFTIMLQSTFNYDIYHIRSSSGQMITLSPDMNMKIGPYVGWKWFFLGYTFDLKKLGLFDNSNKREIEFSIYSSQVGIDLFYRRTGSDYKIRNVYLGENINAEKLINMPFDGINIGITGVNLYYIFNHKRFSYPAAFSQSTCQKISCGSWLAGVGFTNNSVEIDHDKLQNIVQTYCKPDGVKLDSGLMFNRVKYYDFNVSGGYAYNWVFAKNWLFCASASIALAYKHTQGDWEGGKEQRFRLDNVNVDGIGRFGIVYNNTRWYAGASAILHSYNYHKTYFSTNNVFGSLNLYVGYNFGKKKEYR